MSTDVAFAKQLDGLRKQLTAYARHLAHDYTIAEELAAETIAKAWGARENYHDDGNLRAWTFTILRNLFLTQVRRSRWDGGYLADLQSHLLPNGVGAQEATVELTDTLRALERLPRAQADALLLMGTGATYEEAAAEQHCALGTVKSRVCRARGALREMVS